MTSLNVDCIPDSFLHWHLDCYNYWFIMNGIVAILWNQHFEY